MLLSFLTEYRFVRGLKSEKRVLKLSNKTFFSNFFFKQKNKSFFFEKYAQRIRYVADLVVSSWFVIFWLHFRKPYQRKKRTKINSYHIQKKSIKIWKTLCNQGKTEWNSNLINFSWCQVQVLNEAQYIKDNSTQIKMNCGILSRRSTRLNNIFSYRL